MLLLHQTPICGQLRKSSRWHQLLQTPPAAAGLPCDRVPAFGQVFSFLGVNQRCVLFSIFQNGHGIHEITHDHGHSAFHCNWSIWRYNRGMTCQLSCHNYCSIDLSSTSEKCSSANVQKQACEFVLLAILHTLETTNHFVSAETFDVFRNTSSQVVL